MTFEKGKSGNPSGGLRTHKPWREALERAVKRRDAGKDDNPQMLEVIADQCVSDAAAGVMLAVKEIGDRLDGKAVQGVELGVAVTVTAIERTIVDPGNIIDVKPEPELPEDDANRG